jgi:hypothetical protein
VSGTNALNWYSICPASSYLFDSMEGKGEEIRNEGRQRKRYHGTKERK